jgi:hypothetical protein
MAANVAVEAVPQLPPPGPTQSWWIHRHEKMNAIARNSSQPGSLNAIDLIYIGDSIVQKFETAGRKVWEVTIKLRCLKIYFITIVFSIFYQ